MRESTRTAICAAIGAALGSTSVVGSAAAEGAAPGQISGVVTAAESRWGYGGDIIVTETTIAKPDGSSVVVHQLGGEVGDVGMVVTHSPPLLPVGAFVRIETREAMALTGRRWQRVTNVLESSDYGTPTLPFVATQTANGTPLVWESSCAIIGVEKSGAETVPGDGEFAAIESSINEWNSKVAGCSYMDINYIGPIALEPKLDGINVIRFREDRWCRPASGDDPELCHESVAAGLTFLSFGASGDRAGAILDADIELNGVNFRLVDNDGQGTGSSACAADISNTLTHELGHFIGLDHTCWDGKGVRPVDHLGAPVPLCDLDEQLPDAIRDSTMYAFQDCGETKKRSLEPDDIEFVCSTYPSADDPGQCTHPDLEAGGFCSVAPASEKIPSMALMLLATFFVFVGGRRRQNTRRRPRS